ncbi:unnamed protein product [Cuscuta campestris]|uniref:Peroxisomal membrane protein PEX14 n=1 Tax=Cuscuta campestris TaxID=132261 RepID=A0A484MXQ6_9ASTE|nr:unnamed protein product [Cuscuta campestris]
MILRKKGISTSTASESVQQSAEGIQSSNLEAAKEKHSPSVFVNSEPIREDQVQNAVEFLADPKVKGSPVMYKRSFLERKGLTKEKIDESFRRVPVSTRLVFHPSLKIRGSSITERRCSSDQRPQRIEGGVTTVIT